MSFLFLGDDDDVKNRRTWLWLLFWFGVALAIRLSLLTIKAAWMDEVATTLFSLGNYSRLIPLNEVMSLDSVLKPLQYTPDATVRDVVQNLLAEDNHPPIYFVLAHVWMNVWRWLGGSADGYASLWAARSLSAFFGAIAVPAVYCLGWLSCRSRLVSQLSAVLMAVSPFSVFLSQEARHYTLAMLCVIASLCCFVVVTKALLQGKSAYWLVAGSWVVVNTIGLSVHYFFGLSLLAEALVLLVMLIQQCRADNRTWRKLGWLNVYAAVIGTLLGTLLWLPVLLNFYGSPQTSFLRVEQVTISYWLNPIWQSLAGWFYTVLSPMTNGFGWVSVTLIVVSCVLLLAMYSPWLTWVLGRSLIFQFRRSQFRPSIQLLGGFFLFANALFFVVCYASGFDITRGHRYTFVFSPALVVLVAMGLAPFWLGLKSTYRKDDFRGAPFPFVRWRLGGRTFVVLVIAIALVGSQFIVFKRSNLKFYKADRLIQFVQAESTLPVVIADSALITPQPIVIGLEIISVAWEIYRDFNPEDAAQNWQAPPRFLLVERNDEQGVMPEGRLRKAVRSLSDPFDLWLLGDNTIELNELGSVVDLTSEQCRIPEGGVRNRGSFPYVHYVCDGLS